MTRQAYFQDGLSGFCTGIEGDLVLKEVLAIRERHGKLGTRKLYGKLDIFMLSHGIKMGRDALFDLLAANGLLIRKRKRGTVTTDSHHWLRKYPNLIRGHVPTGIEQLWVSDITYWEISSGFVYISFVTDAYSRKIVGYHVAGSLDAIESVQALEMALSGLSEVVSPPMQLIHHSDRGVQYCSHGYVKRLQDYGVRISMTENGDPLENAIAERLNGIIKGEYLTGYEVEGIGKAKELLDWVVGLYNSERPHMSIGNLTPDQVHQHDTPIKTERLWKNYYKKKPEPSAIT